MHTMLMTFANTTNDRYHLICNGLIEGNVSDDGLAMLSDALTNLKDLTSITLNFKNTQVRQAAKDKMKQKFKTFIIL